MKEQGRLPEEEALRRTNKILMYVAELLQREGLITVDEKIRIVEALRDEI